MAKNRGESRCRLLQVETQKNGSGAGKQSRLSERQRWGICSAVEERSRIRRSSTTIQSERAPAKSNKTNFRNHKKRACSSSGHIGSEPREKQHWSSSEAREITSLKRWESREKMQSWTPKELRKTRCIICRFLPLMYSAILEYFELIRGQLLHVLEAQRGRCKC